MYAEYEHFKTIISHSIKKRSLFNFVGSIFKTAFGTLDEDDADYYNNVINTINTDEKELVNIIKQQAQVVQSTISNFNNSVTNLERNRKIFDENFQKLNNVTKKLERNYFDLSFKQLIDEHFSLLILMINEFQHEISLLINSILFAKSNQIHPIVINSIQFINELKKISPQLSLIFPVPLEIENAETLMQIASIKTFMKDNKIIYVISNPLIERTPFFLYNLIASPIKKTNSDYIFVLPSVKYLAIDELKANYFSLQSLDECHLLTKNNLLCNKNEPIYSTHVRPICETELFFSSNNLSKECKYHVVSNPPEIWKKLINKNRWMYILPKETDVTINCKKQESTVFLLQHIILANIGILELGENCKLYTSSTTLITETSYIQSEFNAFIPNVTFGVPDCCEYETEKQNKLNLTELNLPLSRPISLETDQLRIASEKLEKIKNLADQMNSTSLLDRISNNNYFIYTLCILLKLFVLYLLYRIYKYVSGKRKARNCCQNITNCLTLNLMKERESDVRIDVKYSDNGSNEQSSLRRSSRIAKLKETS